MKISKTLLQAIAVGVTLGVTSCGIVEDNREVVKEKDCDENCKADQDHKDAEPDWANCPGCGMG
jgi:hypothetical protein